MAKKKNKQFDREISEIIDNFVLSKRVCQNTKTLHKITSRRNLFAFTPTRGMILKKRRMR